MTLTASNANAAAEFARITSDLVERHSVQNEQGSDPLRRREHALSLVVIVLLLRGLERSSNPVPTKRHHVDGVCASKCFDCVSQQLRSRETPKSSVHEIRERGVRVVDSLLLEVRANVAERERCDRSTRGEAIQRARPRSAKTRRRIGHPTAVRRPRVRCRRPDRPLPRLRPWALCCRAAIVPPPRTVRLPLFSQAILCWRAPALRRVVQANAVLLMVFTVAVWLGRKRLLANTISRQLTLTLGAVLTGGLCSDVQSHLVGGERARRDGTALHRRGVRPRGRGTRHRAHAVGLRGHDADRCLCDGPMSRRDGARRHGRHAARRPVLCVERAAHPTIHLSARVTGVDQSAFHTMASRSRLGKVGVHTDTMHPLTRFTPSRAIVCALLASALAPAGCSEPSLDQVAQSVVYGTDDRTDVYAHANMALRTLTQQSIVALMRPSRLDTTDPMNITFTGDTLGEAFGLCAGERFATDPTAAHCSGTLIDDDLVLTAGHCIETMADCANTRMVFNYFYDSAGTLRRVTSDDVFTCTAIAAREYRTLPDGTNQDYAILRIDRVATPRFAPAVVRRGGAVTMGQRITVIGFGSGIPAKIDSGGEVTDPRTGSRDYYEANTDTFQGNSGSGVFDTASREVVGILVRGATDYVMRGACRAVNVCANTPGAAMCTGESINFVQPAIDDYCRRNTSARLCGTPGADAGPDARTDASMTVDAGRTVPPAWTCDPSYYNAGDDCDCECGAPDPDCSNPALRVTNCTGRETCSAAGRCVTAPEDGGAADSGAPAGWTCDPLLYNSRGRCDCECGVRDPDCNNPIALVENCTAGMICGGDGRCAMRPVRDSGVSTDAQANDSGVSNDSGVTENDSGGTIDTGVSGNDSGVVMDGATADSGQRQIAGGGCGCTVPTRAPSSVGGLGLAALASVLMQRRRRANAR